MDFTSIIGVVIALVVVYFFIKLVVSPILKAIMGIVTFFVVIYLLRRFFGFNFDDLLKLLGISSGLDKWWLGIVDWISKCANYLIGQAKTLFGLVSNNIQKPLNN